MDDIWPIIDHLQSDIREDVPTADLERKYATFKKRYPKIYELITTEPDNDLGILYTMIHTKRRVDRHELTALQADMRISDQLADKYVYTLIDRPSDDILDDARNKIIQQYSNRSKDET